MDFLCELIIENNNTEKLKTILKTIKVDDYNFVNSKIENKKLKATIKAPSISSLIHTLDDYLSCISVAISIVDKDK